MRKKDFYKIDGKKAKKIIKSAGWKLVDLSCIMGFSQSWLSRTLINESIKFDDVEALKDFGIDLTPAIIGNPVNWINVVDIGVIFDCILQYLSGKTYEEIAENLELDRETVRQFAETWEDTQFRIYPEQLKDLYERMVPVHEIN